MLLLLVPVVIYGNGERGAIASLWNQVHADYGMSSADFVKGGGDLRKDQHRHYPGLRAVLPADQDNALGLDVTLVGGLRELSNLEHKQKEVFSEVFGYGLPLDFFCAQIEAYYGRHHGGKSVFDLARDYVMDGKKIVTVIVDRGRGSFNNAWKRAKAIGWSNDVVGN